MKDLASRLRTMIDATRSTPGVVVHHAKITPPMPDEELRELEEALEVQLNRELRAFYAEIGSVSFRWTADRQKFAEHLSDDDQDYIGGEIGIVDLFTMVMGKGGKRWDGELWFSETMNAEQQAPFRAFVPFDHTGELAPGFLLENRKVGPAMRLFDADAGIVPFDYDLTRYLEALIETRGFFYWSQWLGDTGSVEQERYEKATKLLFG